MRITSAIRGTPSRWASTGVAVVLAAGLAACQHSPVSEAKHAVEKAAGDVVAKQPEVQVAVTPANGAQNVAPNLPIVVTATHGKLISVRVTTAAGGDVPGSLAADATRWTSTAPLAFDTTYSVSAAGADSEQRSKQVASRFTTARPAALAYPSVVPLTGETVGIGLPIIIFWSHAVPDRAAAERLLKVTADKPVEGAWHWISSSEVHYRPKVFWPAYTHVTLDIAVGGAPLGQGVYGEKTRRITFTVGSGVISRVSNATKTMTVFRDGQALRTFPVSMGRPTMPTSSGTMVVMEKFKEKYFDSASFGVPRDSADGYYTKVYWDTKFTYGGEYVHAAPWSVQDQGHRNVSHGCINVSPANAQWFYYLSKRGDIIQVIGTERFVRFGDGFTDWNLSWEQWLAGSALQ